MVFYRFDFKTAMPVFALVIACLFLVTACNNPQNTTGGSASASGDLQFHLAYHHAASRPHPQAVVMDCTGEGIVTVEAKVYGPNNDSLKDGGPWDCADGRGTIRSVPAGSGRRIVILGRDADGNAVLRGEKANIQVAANSDNDAGTIDCYTFIPTLQAPANEAAVDPNALEFSWSVVAGATAYQVVVSENGNLDAPVVKEVIDATHYTPSGLSNAKTYFWRVIASDGHSNTGSGSQIWSFSVDPDLTNTPPDAQITSPTDNSIFSFHDDIVFTGIASDSEDGYLSGDSLVWRSDINGQIGAGTTFTTNTLSIGTHQITLSAIDSNGATGKDSITITVQSLGPHGNTTLDSIGDVGMHSAIAVKDDKIFIGYYDETNKSLKVGRSLDDGTSWTFPTIETYGEAGRGTSIALDGDNVFICTTITSAPKFDQLGLSVSSDGGDTWITSKILPDDTITNNDYSDEYSTSIAVDGTHIYISFLSRDTLNMHIVKSTYSAADWSILSIPPPPEDSANGYYSSMILHRGKSPMYVSHTGYANGNVYLTTVAPSTMEERDTALVDQVGVQNCISGYTASASVDVVVGDILYLYNYVAYYDPSEDNLDLKFAVSNDYGNSFTLSTIDNSSSAVGKYPSMAVSDNTILIAYYDEFNGNLKFAKSSDHGQSWDIDTVDDSTDDVGRFASLAVDGQNVYISYYNATKKDLKFAKSIDSGDTW